MIWETFVLRKGMSPLFAAYDLEWKFEILLYIKL